MSIDKAIEEYIQLVIRREELNLYRLDEQEPIYESENEILSFYGLPPSREISDGLQNAVLNNYTLPDLFVYIKKYLSDTASAFLNAAPKTDRELLENGRKNKLPFDNVINYMGFMPALYCVYIYEELYCRGKVSTDEAILCFSKFKAHEEIQFLIQSDNEFETKIDFEIYKQLCNEAIPHLDCFMQYAIDINSKCEVDTIVFKNLMSDTVFLYEELTLVNFYIKKISKTGNIFLLDVVVKKRNEWIGISVFVNGAEFEEILGYARFGADESLIRTSLNGGISNIDLSIHAIRQIEITGINLKLKRIDLGNKEGHPVFSVASISEFKTPEGVSF